MTVYVQNVCDDPDHAFHSMDCGPDLEKFRDLSRQASPSEVIAAAGGEKIDWCAKHKLPKAADGIEDVCAIGYMPLFDPDEDLPCRIVPATIIIEETT